MLNKYNVSEAAKKSQVNGFNNGFPTIQKQPNFQNLPLFLSNTKMKS